MKIVVIIILKDISYSSSIVVPLILNTIVMIAIHLFDVRPSNSHHFFVLWLRCLFLGEYV